MEDKRKSLRLHFDIGWFRGEEWCAFKFALLEQHILFGGEVSLTVLWLQFGKFIFCMMLE